MTPSETVSPPASPDVPLRRVPLPVRWLRTRRRRITVAAVCCLLIYVSLLFTMTHLPKVPQALEQQNDKTLHVLAYFALASFAYVTAVLAMPRLPGLALLVLLATSVFAAVDEVTQPYFGRSADVMDWRADVLGALAAIFVLGACRFAFGRYTKRFGRTP